MAKWNNLKTAIAEIIKTNGNQEITGQVLRNVLNNIISSVGENFTFAGIATPTTNPGIPDGNVFYLATEAGTYANFNGIELEFGDSAILEWRGSWVKKTAGFATYIKLINLEQKTLGILEKSAKATQGKDLQIVQNGYWEKGTVLKLSLNSDDARISTIAFGVMYPTGEALNIATPSMNQVREYTLTNDCTRIRVYAGTVSQSGTATMKIETNGLATRVSDIENQVGQLNEDVPLLQQSAKKLENQVRQLNEDVPLLQQSAEKLENTAYGKVYKQTAKATQGKDLQIAQNGYWEKGTVLKLSLNSNDAQISAIAFGVMYSAGEALNIATSSMNQVCEYTLTEDCTRIRVYAGTVSQSGTATMKIETKGVRNNEFISNYIFGSYYKRKDIAKNVGTFFQNGMLVNLRKGTNVKITFNGTAQIDYATFALEYPNREIQNLYKGGINREFNVLLEDDCTKIRYFIHNIASAGIVEFIISSEPQINAAQINGGSMSILGDSYSTYGLWIPAGNFAWYGIDGEDGNNSQTNNVNSVTQTWWYKLCKKLGVSLMLNESYSGSTICNTGYSGNDAQRYSLVHRMVNSMGQENALKPKPNIIVLFGGTNDSWANSPLGELKYSDWTDDDLKNVLPAICYMFYYVQKWNPGALILNVVNTELKSDIVNGFKKASEYYGIHNIELSSIEKQNGHPSINGMESICNQIYEYIKNL